MANSTSSLPAGKSQSKPSRPPGSPLFAHATKRWAKKVRGKLNYFGSWADGHQAALELWLEQKDELLAGRKPRAKAGVKQVSVQDACDHYLDHIEELVQKGKRTPHWYQDIRGTCRIIKKTIGPNWTADGLSTDDFKELADRFEVTSTGRQASPVTTKGHIMRTRGMFNWLMKAGHVKTVPKYGVNFDAPSQNEVDNHRDDQQTKLFTRSHVRALLRQTNGNTNTELRMHAAILLAINTGCQNEDIQTMKFKHIDWKNGWYVQPRTKKAKKRRAKLWSRTVKALNAMVGDRKRDSESLVFLSKTDGEWHGRNCIAKEFKTIREDAGIDIDGCGFQWLRHTFITTAIETGDRDAVQIAVGHANRDITDNYIHSVYDPRQVKIAKHVESWLIGGAK